MIEILDKYLAELGLDDNNVTKQSTMGRITPSPITALSTGITPISVGTIAFSIGVPASSRHWALLHLSPQQQAAGSPYPPAPRL